MCETDLMNFSSGVFAFNKRVPVLFTSECASQQRAINDSKPKCFNLPNSLPSPFLATSATEPYHQTSWEHAAWPNW